MQGARKGAAVEMRRCDSERAHFGHRKRISPSDGFTQRQSETISYRDVAQFGSALRSGRRGRRFKSCHLDQNYRVGCCLPCNFYCVERCRASKMRQHFHRFCATDLSDVRSLGAKPVQHPVISTKKTAPTSVGAVFLSISRVGLRPQVPKVVRDEGTAPTVACSVFFIGDTF